MRDVRNAIVILAFVMVGLGMVNFVSFAIESAKLGGDALNGFEKDGRYYVSNHGRNTEVSHSAWLWSRVHAASVFVSHPLAMIGMVLVVFGYLPTLTVYKRDKQQIANRVASLRTDGPPLAAIRCNGKIGDTTFRACLLGVEVVAGGLCISPGLGAPFAILGTELRGISRISERLTRGLRIDHAGVDADSPLLLNFSPDGEPAFINAVERLLPS